VLWSAGISNGRLDSHFTRMGMSTLDNYHKGVKKGVAYLYGHNKDVAPIGYSFDGRSTPVNESPGVEGDFYTVPSIPETDAYITRLRAGLIREVSVSFIGGEWQCSVCDRDMRSDLECYHFPGIRYQKRGESGKFDAGDVLCTATIERAELVEVSGVYAGSNPDALIKHAEFLAIEGRLTDVQRNIVELSIRQQLPPRRIVVAVPGDIAMGEENRAPQQTAPNTPAPNPSTPPEPDTIQTPAPPATPAPAPAPATTPAVPEPVPAPAPAPSTSREPLPPLDTTHEILEARRAHLEVCRNILAASGAVSLGADDEERDRNTLTMAPTALEDLRRRAAIGDAHVNELIESALQEGTRADGTTFDRAGFEVTLRKLSPEDISRFRDDWKRRADAVFPSGRQTPNNNSKPPKVDTIPASAYLA